MLEAPPSSFLLPEFFVIEFPFRRLAFVPGSASEMAWHVDRVPSSKSCRSCLPAGCADVRRPTPRWGGYVGFIFVSETSCSPELGGDRPSQSVIGARPICYKSKCTPVS